MANSVDKRLTLDLEAHGTDPSVFSGQVARAVGGAGRSSLLAAAHMEDIVAFVSDDENLTTVVAGVAVVGATIVGGLASGARSRRRRKRLSANAKRNVLRNSAPLNG